MTTATGIKKAVYLFADGMETNEQGMCKTHTTRRRKIVSASLFLSLIPKVFFSISGFAWQAGQGKKRQTRNEHTHFQEQANYHGSRVVSWEKVRSAAQLFGVSLFSYLSFDILAKAFYAAATTTTAARGHRHADDDHGFGRHLGGFFVFLCY